MADAPNGQLACSLPRTDLDWLLGHLDAMYAHDARGRLCARRAPAEGPPPRFVFARTRLGCVWRFSAAMRPETVRALARLAGQEPGAALVPGERPAPPDRLEPMRRALEAEAPITRAWSGPTFRFVEAAPGREADGVELAAEPGDPRLEAWAQDVSVPVSALRAALPVAASTYAGRVVSTCRVARGEVEGFAQAGVWTAESARGRGHAPRVVRAWAGAVQAAGGHPLYTTAWSNRASLAVARKLGLEAFACKWTFD